VEIEFNIPFTIIIFKNTEKTIHQKNMKTQKIYLALFLSFLFVSCNNSKREATGSESKTTELQESQNMAEINQDDIAEGFQLMEANCYSCHSPNASHENRAAPPMEAVKRHYIKNGTTQEEFTKDLIAFLNDPSEEKSKMKGAIKRFNVMPKMNFSEDKLTKIAAYIYNADLETPDWFEEHYKSEKGKHNQGNNELSPLEMGQKFAMQTKGVLGKNLLGAINTKGTEHAVSFCSTQAIPLTDSMAVALNAYIKRVSDKNRNPDNKANESELKYIEETKQRIANGQDPKPQLLTIADKEVGYYPIMTNQMCMQCHGQPKTEVLPATLAKINKLYPNDKATGYTLNQLRGIWVVEMDKK